MKKAAFLLLIFAYSAYVMSQQNNNPVIKKVTSDFNIRNIDSLIIRLKTVNSDIETKGIKYFSQENTYLLTGYSYGEFYDWDLYFENIYMSYYGVSDYCFTNLKSFLRRQNINGFVSRSLKIPYPKDQFKPFLAQIALLGSIQKNDFKWLSEVTSKPKKGIAEGTNTKDLGFDSEISPSIGQIADGVEIDATDYVLGRSYYNCLKEYIRYWFWFQDFDKNGLPVWSGAGHSGMDNQFSRAGVGKAFRYEGVDLACYLYRELKAMAILAEKMGKPEDAKSFTEQAAKLGNRINSTFWNEKEGFYFDRDEYTGEQLKVKSVAGFMPMFIGVASKKQAERMVKEHLMNKKEFWTEFPVPSYAMTEKDYDQNPVTHGECNWRGPAWIPTNYMIFHGLMDYGYTDIAKDLAQKTFDMVFAKNKTTREYYNAETGAGIGLNPFWGWSTLAYFMPFEYELNYNPAKISNQKIQAIGTENFGIEFNSKKK